MVIEQENQLGRYAILSLIRLIDCLMKINWQEKGLEVQRITHYPKDLVRSRTQVKR